MSEQEKYNKIIDAIRNKANEILPKGWLKRSFLPFDKNVEHDIIIIFKN